jgi:alkanesulfonate monooxygenase SsuD/methylene tetrahydromethanopterin reductase-like flavin-dependent oxidoreductase (luciferase family)
MARHRARLAIGSALTVKNRLLSLAAATRADELMLTTMVYDHAARRHSYELLAEVFGLARG